MGERASTRLSGLFFVLTLKTCLHRKSTPSHLHEDYKTMTTVLRSRTARLGVQAIFGGLAVSTAFKETVACHRVYQTATLNPCKSPLGALFCSTSLLEGRRASSFFSVEEVEFLIELVLAGRAHQHGK